MNQLYAQLGYPHTTTPPPLIVNQGVYTAPLRHMAHGLSDPSITDKGKVCEQIIIRHSKLVLHWAVFLAQKRTRRCHWNAFNSPNHRLQGYQERGRMISSGLITGRMLSTHLINQTM